MVSRDTLPRDTIPVRVPLSAQLIRRDVQLLSYGLLSSVSYRDQLSSGLLSGVEISNSCYAVSSSGLLPASDIATKNCCRVMYM
jgi:hypothetical protein